VFTKRGTSVRLCGQHRPRRTDEDHRDEWLFHVVYEDRRRRRGPHFGRAAPLHPTTGGQPHHRPQHRPRWAMFKKIYAAIADTLAMDQVSFNKSNMAVLRQVFGMPLARITIGKLKAKLNDWSKTIHPDKAQHIAGGATGQANLLRAEVPVRDQRPADQPPLSRPRRGAGGRQLPGVRLGSVFRSSGRGDNHRQVRHIEGRLGAFIGGNYTALVGWWRADCERAERRRKPRKPQLSDQRWDHRVADRQGFCGARAEEGGGRRGGMERREDERADGGQAAHLSVHLLRRRCLQSLRRIFRFRTVSLSLKLFLNS